MGVERRAVREVRVENEKWKERGRDKVYLDSESRREGGSEGGDSGGRGGSRRGTRKGVDKCRCAQVEGGNIFHHIVP